MKLLRSLLLSLALINPAGAVDYVAGPGNNGGAGQIIGTATNDNACAGCVGEVITANDTAALATITITIAAPGIISWAAHGFSAGSAFQLATTGALPTGLTAGTTFYVCSGANLLAGSFAAATTIANALAGTCITTTGSQSGTQSGLGGAFLVSTTAAVVDAVTVTAGDWDCFAGSIFVASSGTTITVLAAQLGLSPTITGSQSASQSSADLTLPFTTSGTNQFPMSVIRVSVAVSTPVYLVEVAAFGTSAMTASGAVTCRRAR